MRRLYSISITWHDASRANLIAVDTALGNLGDWIRFSGFQWFIYTDAQQQRISNEVLNAGANAQFCVVAALTPEMAQGFAPPWIWSWLNDKMAKQISDQH